MNFYESLVNQVQMNYYNYYSYYQNGSTPYKLTSLPKPSYDEQIEDFINRVEGAEVIIVGGGSGLSAAGDGDFYYEDNESYRKYFGKFRDKYGFKGAFSGMYYPYKTRNEFWGYLATFLNTTQSAELRKPYKDLDEILRGKDFSSLLLIKTHNLQGYILMKKSGKFKETKDFSNVLNPATTVYGMQLFPLRK